MEAGALGAEIVISGKLRTERARSEKFRAGYMPKSGDPAIKYVRKAVTHIQLKPGIFGVKVSIMPSGIEFPDKVEFIEEKTSEAAEELSEASAGQSPESKIESEKGQEA
jgi:small subunit ribosomal protein S3